MYIDMVLGQLIIKAILIMTAFLMAIVIKQAVRSYLIRATSHLKPFAEFIGSLVGLGTFILILFAIIL